MCGICGFFDLANDVTQPEQQTLLLDMCASIQHRGPDDLGTYFSPFGAALGVDRLSIIDLSSGHQPIANEDETCWVVQNGEIYNYPDLKKRLEQSGHQLKTHSDTEAIVHAYEEWGLECFHELEGMFAFAVWDAAKQMLVVARDRLGKKPLYYYWQPGEVFVFASEIKALLKHPACKVQIDPQALDLFLTLGYIPAPLTIFTNIKKLAPAHYLKVDRQLQLKISAYWDIPIRNVYPEDISPSFPQLEQKLEELLERAVQARLLADVPIGVFLSGGLDSSVITALMKRLQPDQLKSFSVRFRELNQDESLFAQEVAQSLGTDHYELLVDHCPPDLLRKLIWHADEPLADPAMVPTYLLSEFARTQVKVVLTGEGGDELFAGYFYHPLERQAAHMDWLPHSLKQRLLAPLARMSNAAIGRTRIHPRTIWSWELNSNERLLAWLAVFTDADSKRWLTQSANTLHSKRYAAQLFDQTIQFYPSANALARTAYLETKIPLADCLLMKVDKMSMAASLEARCPYLDHHLVEFAVGLPESLKQNNGTNKVILRQLANRLLPVSITQREKHGFDVPIRRWLTEDLKELFWDTVTSHAFEKLDLIDRSHLQELWNNLALNIPGRARQLWSLLILATWSEIFAT